MTQQTNVVAQQQKQVHPVVAFKNFLATPNVTKDVAKRLGSASKDFCNSLIELVTDTQSIQTFTPSDILQCAYKAAALHLPLNKQLGRAYIVPFKNKGVTKPTFIIGYKGLVQLAKNSGQYKTINTGVVYEGQLKNINYLSGDIDISGTPVSRKVEGFFAHVVEVTGFTKTFFMTAQEMAHYAKTYSPSLKSIKEVTEETLLTKFNLHSERGPEVGVGWLADSITMAKKVVLKQLLDKWGSLSIEVQAAIAADESVDNSPEMERNNESEDEKQEFTAYQEVDKETGEIQTQETFPGDETAD